MTITRLLLVVAVSILATPLAVEAQGPKVYRVGILLQGSPPTPGSRPGHLRTTLRDLGYVEGQNLVFAVRGAEGQNERMLTLAAELVELKPDVIVVESTPAAIAAKRATTEIPVVMVNVSDPVNTGIVASLARPGGNVTAGTDVGTEMAVKALELLRDLVPKASRVAVLMADNPIHPFQLKLIQDAAKSIRLSVLPTMVRTEADLEAAYAQMVSQKAEALIWLGGAPVSTRAQRDRMIALSARWKLPTLYPGGVFVEAGGLLSYAPTTAHKWRTAAIYVDKILKGARPADLPVEQPTTIELVINLQTAKALRHTIPPALLLRAARVIG